MKSIVIYYSQTGSTRKIAQAIQKGIRESAGQCDIARLQDVNSENLAEYDLIGLGSPVWHRREPAHVMNFIEYTMNEVEGKHGFAFCTHGLYPGHYMARVVPIMAQRGLIVIGWNDWYGSVTMPEKPKPYFTDGHPDEIDLTEAEDFGKQIVERSKRISAGEKRLIPVLPTGDAYDEIYPGPPRKGQPGGEQRTTGMWKRVSHRSFDYTLNKERCRYPKCTLCADNCPTQSIDLTQSPPILIDTCERCWLCEQICPRGAIEVDWEPIVEFIKKNVVPNFVKVSEEAEAKGRFRRLIPLEEVGWVTYWYTVKKPPRIKPE